MSAGRSPSWRIACAVARKSCPGAWNRPVGSVRIPSDAWLLVPGQAEVSGLGAAIRHARVGLESVAAYRRQLPCMDGEQTRIAHSLLGTPAVWLSAAALALRNLAVLLPGAPWASAWLLPHPRIAGLAHRSLNSGQVVYIAARRPTCGANLVCPIHEYLARDRSRRYRRQPVCWALPTRGGGSTRWTEKQSPPGGPARLSAGAHRSRAGLGHRGGIGGRCCCCGAAKVKCARQLAQTWRCWAHRRAT